MKIAHFGTFDVDNYGDLLFPHIAEFRLNEHQWEHVSPTDNLTVFKDSLKIVSFENALKNKYDAVVIGGGNIIHLKTNKSTVYENYKGFAYANLWVGAAKLATRDRIPFIFNAPGISKKINNYLHKKIAAATFNNANYAAFRERYSKQIAVNTFKNNTSHEKIEVVPDSAFDIGNMWPIKNSRKSDYIAVNLNERYHEPIKETAYYLDEISRKLELPVKLIVIGDCHGDKEFTKEVSGQMVEEHQISASDSLKEVAHLIGNAKYFFGSSMHAFITALSYGVPALLVLNSKPMHKFRGLLELTELDEKVICDSFKNSLDQLESPAFLSEKVKVGIQNKLDNHWKKVEHIISGGKPAKGSFFIRNYEKLLRYNLWYKKLKRKIRFW